MKIEDPFHDCKSCQLKYIHIQASLPVKSHRHTGSMKENNSHNGNTAIRVPDEPCSTFREASATAKLLYDQ